MLNTTEDKHILISRVDAIGDVILTLPMCGYLKSVYPDIKISFLGRTYTKAIIEACPAIDNFINWDDLKNRPEDDQVIIFRSKCIDTVIHVYPQKRIAQIAHEAEIKTRIGTLNRAYHWLTCNKLVGLSRRESPLHETQLNISLLQPLKIFGLPQLNYLPSYYGQIKPEKLSGQYTGLLRADRFNLILHPKSHGSGREWSLNHFKELINLLPPEHFNIMISGSDKEKELLKDWLPTLPQHVIDITGKFTLSQFIAFTAAADGLVAASTGPLHIAAFTGINALGLYPATKPINAGRWGPVGKKAEFMESEGDTLDTISAEAVYGRIKAWIE